MIQKMQETMDDIFSQELGTLQDTSERLDKNQLTEDDKLELERVDEPVAFGECGAGGSARDLVWSLIGHLELQEQIGEVTEKIAGVLMHANAVNSRQSIRCPVSAFSWSDGRRGGAFL